MLKISLLPLVLALSLWGAGAAAKVQQLPDFAANSKEASIAVDINANGQVAPVIEDEDGKQRAVLYDKGGWNWARWAAATAIPHREFMGMLTMAVGAAVALMLLRRRYRGIALARY
jgi:N-acetylmuramoyl-L-alanine amidase CwlA